MSAPIGRRSLLGYVGTAAVGTAVGAGVGVTGARALDDTTQATPAPATGAGRTISPWGSHQPGVAAHPSAVTELVALDLHDRHHRNGDRELLGRLLRVWTSDIEAVTRGQGTPGDTAPWLASANADLSVTVGFGPRLFAGAWDLPAPSGFARVPSMEHDRLEKAWTGGDLVLVVTGREGSTVGHAVRRLVADARPFAQLRWRQSGSWNPHDPQGRPVTGRNLFGQVDGSANPTPGSDLFDQTVWIEDGAWSGGTTLVVRRIRMDLPTWDELTRSEQEGSMGRDLAHGAPLTGGGERDDVVLSAREGSRYVIAPLSHVRRSHPSTNGGRRIFRKAANYEVTTGSETETGLLFQSYQRDLTDQFVPIQCTLDEGDELNEWTTAIGSAEFAILPGFARGEWLGQGVLSA